VRLEITTGASRLSLPLRPAGGAPESMPIAPLVDRVRPRIEADPRVGKDQTITRTGPDAKGRITLHKRLRDEPETLTDIGTTMSGGSDWTMSIREGDPNSSVWRLEWFSRLAREGWDTGLRSTLELTSTAEHFRIRESIRATEGGKAVFERRWDHRIKRDLL
jgi:hypothetical protein